MRGCHGTLLGPILTFVSYLRTSGTCRLASVSEGGSEWGRNTRLPGCAACLAPARILFCPLMLARCDERSVHFPEALSDIQVKYGCRGMVQGRGNIAPLTSAALSDEAKKQERDS